MTVRTEGWVTTVNLYGLEQENEDVPAVFQITIEEYPAEPTSYGLDRGTEKSYEARLEHIRFGEMIFDRDTVVKMYGEDAVKKVEAVAKERYEDEQTFGPL